MKKVKLISTVLALALICTLFAGCGAIMKVGDSSISENIFVAALAQANSYYQQNYGFSLADYLDTEMMEGKTGADLLKEEAGNLIREFESVKLFAEQNGITLTAEEKDTIKQNKESAIESAGGKKAFIDSLTQSGVNEEYYDYIMERQQLYTKLYTEMFTGEGEFAPKEEEIISNLKNGYVCVKHVLIQAKEGDADYADKKKKAEEALAKAKSGSDFDALIKEYGEDPGMEGSAGYVIDKDGATPGKTSTMIPEFTTASWALADNQISEIVTSSYGFHIIKRYPLTDEYIKANLESLGGDFGVTAFTEKLNEFMETLEITYTSAYDKLDLYKIFGVEKSNGAAADAAAENAEGGEAAPAEGGESAPAEVTVTPADGSAAPAEGAAAPAEGAAAPADGSAAPAEGGIEVGTAVPQQ